MSLRDTVKDWLREGKEIEVNNPLCSKRLVIETLSEILESFEEDSTMSCINSYYLAKDRIRILINDIENGKLNAGEL